ncbi:hypothetical protein D2E26_0718 [Bifidobacterium dolichotidis]|uniref:DUF3043 domain-containing protein n=1 Tax=Bifidobacterium dolichotidis TaxID=2306976 RepID=A0A430FTL7_9BIFI|nr:DUF3043 domain-containing protein [Bifidobacterium dolichotidis]RSX56155.1 hypothetical protein D2E26_0718 [Bifidobacterium dolichotidis]
MAAKNSEEQTSDAKNASNSTPNTTQGKGRPTPKRKVAQAQGLRPLVPENTKEQRKRAKERMRARENREYEAMRTGDINNMPKSERLPWRVYIRDYVDARFNIGEYFIPVAIAILLLSVLFTAIWPNGVVSIVLMGLMYVYLIAIVIDVAVMWKRLKKKLIAKYGEQAVAKGMRSASYAWSRAIQMRRWRLPKPRYAKRSEYAENGIIK